MTISDLLTLIGILLAVVAFLSEKNREYIILKLSNLEIGIFVIVFVFIHFLLSYQWWTDKCDFLKRIQIDNFPTPDIWAYVISIVVLFYLIWKIFFGQFPLSKKQQLLSYYKKLLLSNDIPFLAQLIDKYHSRQVVNFLRKRKTIIEKDTVIWEFHRQGYSKAYKKAIKGRELVYGNIIYGNIILNDVFLDNIANSNPYLFSPIIQELNEQDLKNEDFVNRYLKILMKNKNGNLFREIRNNQNLGEYGAYSIDEERPILYALFNDIKVCSINQAWRGIGEPAILEMQEEAKKEYSVLRESDREQDRDTIWSFRITIAIWYFDIMIREAIKQNINDHMWMFYYSHFVSVLISNMQELPFPNSDLNKRSRNFDLIETIFSNMMDWKDVIIKSKNNNLSKSVFDCMGECIYKVSITDKLRTEDKNYLVNWVWENLIKSFGEDDKSREIIDKLIRFGFNMFKRPSMLFQIAPEAITDESKMYLSALQILWDRRDIPILTDEVGQRASDFKTQVIDQLLPDFAG